MKVYFIAFLLLLTINLQAQLAQTKESNFLNKTDFKVGYFGSFVWSNGLNVGAEYLWKQSEKTKEKGKKTKTITRQLLLNASLGYSGSPRNKVNNGITTYCGIMYRRIGAKGWLFNLEASPLSIYRSVLPETYKVEGNEVSRVRFPGRIYYAPSIAIGTGKYRSDKRFSGWYLNLNMTLRTPYNGGTLPTFSLHFGQRFNFKSK